MYRTKLAEDTAITPEKKKRGGGVKYNFQREKLTWDASLMINIGEPGTSPCTCLNSALTSSSL
jgi:hypothetical protein